MKKLSKVDKVYLLVMCIIVLINGGDIFYNLSLTSDYDFLKLIIIKVVCYSIVATIIYLVLYTLSSIIKQNTSNFDDPILALCSFQTSHLIGDRYKSILGVKFENFDNYQILTSYLYRVGVNKDETFVRINENREGIKGIYISVDDYLILYNEIPLTFIFFSLDIAEDFGFIDVENHTIVRNNFLK